MRVLLTNDDGFDALGLRVIYQTLLADKDISKVVVVAPSKQQSTAGVALTLHKPLRLHLVEESYYKVNGTPADCVGLACGLVFKDQIDIVISGVNEGSNLGNDVAYSGTVSAAIQATNMGIRAIAVSLDCRKDKHRNYEFAANTALTWAKLFSRQTLTGQTFLNINVPNISKQQMAEGQIPGAKITRLGRRIYSFDLEERRDPRNMPYYWNHGKPVGHCEEPNTDCSAIDEGYIAVTPVQLDCTNHNAIEVLKSWSK